MKEIENCHRHIANIRLIARGEEVAYVARSRIGRLVLCVARLVSKLSNIPTPDRPRRLAVPKNSTKEVRTLVVLSNCISETAKTLAQPSEPLDERWRVGWAELIADLDKIEQHLHLMEATESIQRQTRR